MSDIIDSFLYRNTKTKTAFILLTGFLNGFLVPIMFSSDRPFDIAPGSPIAIFVGLNAMIFVLIYPVGLAMMIFYAFLGSGPIKTIVSIHQGILECLFLAPQDRQGLFKALKAYRRVCPDEPFGRDEIRLWVR